MFKQLISFLTEGQENEKRRRFKLSSKQKKYLNQKRNKQLPKKAK